MAGDFTLICGGDAYAVRSKATELIVALCGERPEENPNLEIIHGDPDASAYRSESSKPKHNEILNRVIESLDTPAFFSDAKLVWLKRFDFALNAKSKAGKASIDALIAILKEGLPDDVSLVIDGSGVDRRSALFKLAKDRGKCFFFEKTDVKSKDWEKNIRARVMEYCRNNGLSIVPAAAEFLTETCGTDSGRVVGELQKLASYVHPNTHITLEDCRAITSLTPEAAAWSFAEELGKRNLKGALSVLNTILGNGIGPTAALGMATSRFQDMVRIRSAASLLGIPTNTDQRRFMSRIGNIPPQLKERLEGHVIVKSHPYRAWIIFSQSAKFADAKLADCLTVLLKTNRQLVSGGAEPRIALEMLAMDICR